MAGSCFTLSLVYIGLLSVCILDVEGQEHISHATLQTGPDLSQSFDCTGRHDGAYPDYQKGCRQFYLCVSGQTHVSWCSNDTIFNPNSGHCDAPSRVRCVDPEGLAWPSLVGECSYQEDGIYTDYASGCRNFYFCKGGVKTVFSCDENMLFDWRTGSCRQAREVPCFQATCENQPEGLYIDNTESCKRYYLCSNGEKLEFVCPQGKIFNENIMQCDHSRTVSCPHSSSMSCKDLPDGYYPDYEDNCRTFNLCINGELKRYSCPTNLAFNKRSLTCDYPSETTCEKPTNAACEHEPNGVYSLTETGCREFKICREGYTVHSGVCSRGKLMNSATSRCESGSLLTCASVTDSDCENKADGIYPDINIGCSAYFLCFRYRKVVTRFCPPSTLFDYTSNACLSSSLVHCHHFGDEPSFRHYEISQYNCEGRLGLFPDFITGCRRYYICAYGRRDIAVCPEGLRFNAITKQCQEPESVHCRAPQVVGTFQCLKSEEGIYIDVKSGCKRWHECWNEVGGTYSCPPRSWFNVMTRTCDTDDNIRCQNDGAELFDLSTFESRKNRTLQNFETPFTCKEKRNGLYFLGEQNCKVFYICSNGKTFPFICPEGQIYNPKSESCEDTLQISCRQIKELWTQNNEEFSCVSKTDGLYPYDSFNCEKFFICENGRKITAYCPKIHFFNTMVMICDLKSHAKCISVINHKPEESNSSAVTILRTHKGNTTFSLRANQSEEPRPLSKKHDHGFLREQKLVVRKEKTNKENRNRFVDTYLTTSVPVEHDYVDYEFFDYPDSYSDTAEEGKHFGVRRTFYKERHFGKDHNGKTVLSVVDQQKDKGILNGERSVNWEYKTRNVNTQTQNGEVTTNTRSDYDYSYRIGDEYFDPYSDKRNAGRNVFEDDPFALGSSVHQTDIKDGADVKDKIFGTTQKFYRSFKNDDFHQQNTSEKNKTQDDETKHVFVQLTRKTLSSTANSSSPQLKERTEYQGKPIEPRKLSLRSQLRFENTNDTNKLNNMMTRRANKTSEDTVHPSDSNRYTKFDNSSATDQSHKNISSDGLRARNFANIYKRMRKFGPKKQNTTLLVSENRKGGSRLLSRKHLQGHRLLRKQNINVQTAESNEERKNQFVETKVRTVPKESDDEDVYYELYEQPTNDTAEGEKHFGVHRIFYTERHFGKNQNGKAGVSLIEQENDERVSSEEKSVNKKYKKLNVNSQTQNGEVTTNITKDYDFSYHTVYEHFDPYIDKQNAESSVFENEPFALDSTVHHTDVKEGGDVKDKTLDITQKFYKGFKYDDFHHHNTSEKNKTHDDETKRMFLQLIRRTLLPATISSTPKLKERTEQQEKPIEPGKLSFRSQLRFGKTKDAHKLNIMVSRRANETSKGTAHPSSSIRFRETEQSTGRNMAENESYVLSSSVHHRDIKEGHDVKDKIFGNTQKFYKDFRFDDFHQRNTSEKNKTRDDGTKRMFIQLMRRTLSPAASSFSPKLKKRTEHQEKPIEPGKLSFRSQLRFANINDTNKLSSMVTRRANETSEDTVHPSGSNRFIKFDKKNAPSNELSTNSSQHLTSGTTNEEKTSDQSLLHTIDLSLEEIVSNSKNSSKEVVLQESISSSTVSTNALFIQFGLQNITTTTNPSVIGEKPASSEIVFSSMSLPLSYKSTTEPEIIAKMELACSGKEIVFFPDYESGCKRFHVCFHNIKESFNCPGAMLFNPETKTCDVPNNVVCQTPRNEEKFVCRNKITGYYPNYKSGCRTYYECLNGKAFHYSCSTGKLFNTKTMACELAENVSCVDSGKQSTVSDLIKKKHIPDHVHGIPHQFVFDCTNKPNGFYPDYARFCHVFYKCENGIKTSHHCKQGYLFNSDLRTCDFEENVNCNSISHGHSTKIKDVKYDD